MRLLAYLITAMLFVGPAHALDEMDIDGLYRNISPPQPTADATKVEVLEVFWYRCPHCNAFQPYADAYQESKPEYVNFRRMPAVLRDSWVPQAKMFYVAESLGMLEQVHKKIFAAIHKQEKPMSSRADIRSFFVENGADGAKFDAAFDSFSTDSQVRQADAQTRRLGITGVPTIIINGRYRTSGQIAGSYETVLEVVKVLAEKEHKRMSK
jgi:protein dithiol oxidoreductase (disulfide-forming)